MSGNRSFRVCADINWELVKFDFAWDIILEEKNSEIKKKQKAAVKEGQKQPREYEDLEIDRFPLNASASWTSVHLVLNR